MNCLECDSDQLIACITLSFEMPMALRSGSIKIGGSKITHMDAKVAWDAQAPLRGPIYCSACSAEHYYDTREREGLKRGNVLAQRHMIDKGVA